MLNWNKIIWFMILMPVVILLLSGCHAHHNYDWDGYRVYNPPIYTNDVNERGFVTNDYTRNTSTVSRYKYDERYDLNNNHYTPKFGNGNNWGNTCKTRGTC